QVRSGCAGRVFKDLAANARHRFTSCAIPRVPGIGQREEMFIQGQPKPGRGTCLKRNPEVLHVPPSYKVSDPVVLVIGRKELVECVDCAGCRSARSEVVLQREPDSVSTGNGISRVRRVSACLHSATGAVPPLEGAFDGCIEAFPNLRLGSRSYRKHLLSV